MRNNQSPSVYSIYHNALPFYLDRVDISSLLDDSGHFSATFIKELLNGQVALQCDAKDLASGKMRHLYFEARNFEKTYGPKSFGLGYPLIIDTFENDLLVTPLFIWQLLIEPAQTKPDGWVLKHSSEQFQLPNLHLLQHLEKKYGLHLSDPYKKLAYGRQLNRNTLQEICSELIEKIHLHVIGEIDQPLPCPGLEEISTFARQTTLHWSGVLSLFPPYHEPHAGIRLKPEEVFKPSRWPSTEESVVFPWLPPDPEQISALETIARNKITVVEGEDALGKSLTLANLLTHALSNGQKCLVVSERAPALKYAQEQLVKAGIGQLHFLIDDVLYDKMPLMELLRISSAGALSREINFQEDDFRKKQNKFIREKTKADATYHAIRKPIFGEYNWTETVGIFLKNNRIEGREMLSTQLNPSEFEFEPSEHHRLKSSVERSFPLFQKINTLSHPLTNLHEHIFEKENENDALHFVKTTIADFLNKSRQLYHDYISTLDDYGVRLKDYYRQHYEAMLIRYTALNETLRHYSETLGDDFRQAGTGFSLIPAFLSSKKQKIQKAKTECIRLSDDLATIWQSLPCFDFSFKTGKQLSRIPDLTNQTEAFGQALEQWYNNLDLLVQEEIQRLNSRTAHPYLDAKENITDLEFRLDKILAELNEAGLYQRPFEHNALTIPQRQKYLEELITQLENTQIDLRDFHHFFNWQSNWLKLGKQGQKVIRALVKAKPNDWTAAFNSWYFHNLLEKVQSADLPAGNTGAATYTTAWETLRPLLPNRMQYIWHQKQQTELKKLKKENRQLWHFIFDKTGQRQASELPPSDVLRPAFDVISAFFPVLFATPQVVFDIVPMVPAYFDFIIFEEANQFCIEHATSIAALGRKIVLFGSNDTYGQETSLLQYAVESEAPVAKITNRFFPPAQTGISVNPVRKTQYMIENTEARFHEQDSINETEALQVIRLLNQIKRTPQRVFPSVGIVTMTVEQRDFIATYLLRLRQQNAPETEMISQLERNGLSVLHIDELYGRHFEVIILSCTLGMVNLKGTLTKKFTLLNTPQGIGHIRLLINKPVQKFFIIHSLPEFVLDEFLERKREEGTWLLANLIRLAQASANNDSKAKEAALEALGKLNPPRNSETIFIEEIAAALQPYLPAEVMIRQLRLDDIELPLVIDNTPEGRNRIAIVPDGFFADTLYTSHLWEHRQWQRLEANHYTIIPVWSLAWLKNPRHETRLLAGRIIKINQSAE